MVIPIVIKSTFNVVNRFTIVNGTNILTVITANGKTIIITTTAETKTWFRILFINTILWCLSVTMLASVTTLTAFMYITGKLLPIVDRVFSTFWAIKPCLTSIMPITAFVSLLTRSPVASELFPTAYHVQTACSSLKSCEFPSFVSQGTAR